MTAAEACALAVALTCELSEERAAAESWRLVALATIRHAAELQRELAMLDDRSYISRRLAEDRLDLFLDQIDLRREAA